MDHTGRFYLPRVQQPGIRYSCERLYWPPKGEVNVCPVSPLAGWGQISALSVSPRGTIAAFQWLNEDEGGFGLLAVDPEGMYQIPGVGYTTKPNLVSKPIFSPDGRYIAMSCGREGWWSDEDIYTPSLGGVREIGHVVVYETESNTYKEVAVTEEIPLGWLPEDLNEGKWEMLGEPQFFSKTTFHVSLPLGSAQTFRV